MSIFFLADDDSEYHPHDLEGGGVDLEYGYPETNGLSHLNSGPHPFNQSQVRYISVIRSVSIGLLF